MCVECTENRGQRKLTMPSGYREWVPSRERRRRVREMWEQREFEGVSERKRLLDIVGPNPGEDAPG